MGKTVGQGAYGRVCIAKDKVSGNVVAIKLVSKE
jgi:serine/threonine protein kinase